MVKDPKPEIVYKRMKYAEAMKKKVAAAKKKIRAADNELAKLVKSCKHYHSFYKNHGNVGNWDRDDSYWRIYECEDCGGRWEIDQSIEAEKRFPYAINRTYS